MTKNAAIIHLEKRLDKALLAFRSSNDSILSEARLLSEITTLQLAIEMIKNINQL